MAAAIALAEFVANGTAGLALFNPETIAEARAIERLRVGISRIGGVEAAAVLPNAYAAATSCYGKQHYRTRCLDAECVALSKHDEDAAIAFVRQSLPKPIALPEWQPHPNHPPSSQRHCPCGANLRHAHIIYKVENPAANYIVGGCCVIRFMGRSFRKCSGCADEHKNRSNNYCTPCRKAYPDLVAQSATIDVFMARKQADQLAQETQRDAIAKRNARYEAKNSERTAQIVAEKAQKEARRADGLCTKCGICRMAPGSKYDICYKCNFPFACVRCKIGMRDDRFKQCYKCNAATRASKTP